LTQQQAHVVLFVVGWIVSRKNHRAMMLTFWPDLRAVLCCGLQGIPDAPTIAVEEALAAASTLAEQLTDDGTPAYIKVTKRTA
jgi:hypothetical protein